MDVPEHDPKTAGLFREFDELLAAKQFNEAERRLDVIEERRGGHDKEVSKNRVKLKLERN